ncbi:MAG TPA: bacillithiol biosynthesis cysteine-adding enzyme BshC [Salinimicrobium sp.]|nr:bacillithiol biosynthesis cysteine-adding enzyme BshC [Salinimicrobium sp.]
MADCIPYSETQRFSNLILDYLNRKKELDGFYEEFPTLENFGFQVERKKSSFPASNRKILVEILQKQYKGLNISEATNNNIRLLSKENTFTVTTGHQLNLFTGPLYFLYKIVSAINLASQLGEKYPENHFVPVYWMATEDHDFQEINFFNLHGKKFQWNPPENKKTGGAVGELPTRGLDEIFNLFSAEIGSGENAETLKKLFEDAYLKHSNLTDATRYLANELFSEYGLVIIDAHEKDLKKQFAPFMEKELLDNFSYEAVHSKAEDLGNLGYNVQVNSREINLFYLSEGLRERIIEKDGQYFVNETQIEWSRQELLEQLHEYPEKFSPNVILRPLYQEVVLPNLCYIGGGGELAYWLELKDCFERVNIPFPVLLLRNSALLRTQKQLKKQEKLHISNRELFLKKHELINRKVRQISEIDIDFSPQREHLKLQFQNLYELAEKTDKSFLGAVKAQEVKQLKGLDKLEKRLLKAQKLKLGDEVSRVVLLQNQLFPNNGLQERETNFSEFYLEFGDRLIPELIKQLDPLEFEFCIITLGSS